MPFLILPIAQLPLSKHLALIVANLTPVLLKFLFNQWDISISELKCKLISKASLNSSFYNKFNLEPKKLLLQTHNLTGKCSQSIFKLNQSYQMSKNNAKSHPVFFRWQLIWLKHQTRLSIYQNTKKDMSGSMDTIWAGTGMSDLSIVSTARECGWKRAKTQLLYWICF